MKLAVAAVAPNLDEDLVGLVRGEGVSPVEKARAQFERTDGAGCMGMKVVRKSMMRELMCM